MILVLSAVLLMQAPSEAAPREQPGAPAAAAQAQPAAATAPDSAPAHLDAGLAAFRARRLVAARGELEKALAADPQSAAANFYLGYTLYKLGEPSRRMNANKERARELFAKAFGLDPAFKPVFGRAAAK